MIRPLIRLREWERVRIGEGHLTAARADALLAAARASDLGGAEGTRIAQADIYQMIAYGHIYGCPELMLLYPWHAGLGEEAGSHHYAVSGSAARLSVATVNVEWACQFVRRNIINAIPALQALPLGC